MKIKRWNITALDEDGPCKCIGHMMDAWSTGDWVMWKDVEAERERIRDAVYALTDAIRESAPEFRQSGWIARTDELLRLARKADKAVKG